MLHFRNVVCLCTCACVIFKAAVCHAAPRRSSRLVHANDPTGRRLPPTPTARIDTHRCLLRHPRPLPHRTCLSTQACTPRRTTVPVPRPLCLAGRAFSPPTPRNRPLPSPPLAPARHGLWFIQRSAGEGGRASTHKGTQAGAWRVPPKQRHSDQTPRRCEAGLLPPLSAALQFSPSHPSVPVHLCLLAVAAACNADESRCRPRSGGGSDGRSVSPSRAHADRAAGD